MKNILKEGNKSKNLPTKVQKPFWIVGNLVYLLILGKFPYSWIQIRIPNMDSQVSAMRIHNTGILNKQGSAIFPATLLTLKQISQIV